MRFALAACVGTLLHACSSSDVTTLAATETIGDGAAQYAEGRVPLPECADFDYARCDIRERACLQNLGAIARCLRGSDPALPIPSVSFWSEADAASDLLTRLASAPTPGPNHFEIALERLGLSVAGSLEPEAIAERLAREWTAYYNHSRKDIAIIEHADRADPLGDDAIVVHEMIHFYQDLEHDLGAFDRSYRRDNDGNLRGASLVEGEARMHERRYFAALSGLDISEIDLDSSFHNLTRNSVRWLLSQADLYTASQLIVPYAHGAEYVHGVWASEGQQAVRALFDEPPATMREILAQVWGGETYVELAPFPEPDDPNISGANLAAWTTMGAWGVYLLAARGRVDDARAERIALSWRGDQLEVFSFADRETAARWRIEMSDSAVAAELVLLLAAQPLVSVAQRGRSVTLRTATADAPEGL